MNNLKKDAFFLEHIKLNSVKISHITGSDYNLLKVDFGTPINLRMRFKVADKQFVNLHKKKLTSMRIQNRSHKLKQFES